MSFSASNYPESVLPSAPNLNLETKELEITAVCSDCNAESEVSAHQFLTASTIDTEWYCPVCNFCNTETTPFEDYLNDN